MTEYINKVDAIKAIFGCKRHTGIDDAPYEYADDLLHKLPTIDIITCKECKYWQVGNMDLGIDCHCAEGERKTDD